MRRGQLSDCAPRAYLSNKLRDNIVKRMTMPFLEKRLANLLNPVLGPNMYDLGATVLLRSMKILSLDRATLCLAQPLKIKAGRLFTVFASLYTPPITLTITFTFKFHRPIDSSPVTFRAYSRSMSWPRLTHTHTGNGEAAVLQRQ